MHTVACVKFSESGPSQVFTLGRLTLEPDDFCVVEYDGEEATGFVATVETRCGSCRRDRSPYPSVLRKATEREIEAWRRLKEREQRALVVCKEKAREHNLPMSVSSARVSEKQNKITFNFTADKRVDFRNLVKDLASTLKARIELWQIGVRDEARQMDGYGICGMRLCCASWVRDFKAVTIRMAKNQDLALSPSKLSGQCGRLMCCIQYENEQYREINEETPRIGAVVRSLDIEGEVVSRNLLGRWVGVRSNKDGEVYKVLLDEIGQAGSCPHAGPASRTSDGEATGTGESDTGASGSATPSGRRNGGGSTSAVRSGIPPRPASALRREEAERLRQESSPTGAEPADALPEGDASDATLEAAREESDASARRRRRPPRRGRRPAAAEGGSEPSKSAGESQGDESGEGDSARRPGHRSRRGRRGGRGRKKTDNAQQTAEKRPEADSSASGDSRRSPGRRRRGRRPAGARNAEPANATGNSTSRAEPQPSANGSAGSAQKSESSGSRPPRRRRRRQRRRPSAGGTGEGRDTQS